MKENKIKKKTSISDNPGNHPITKHRDVDNSRKAGKIPGCQSDFTGWKSTNDL